MYFECVKFFNDVRCHGFIEPDGGAKDDFVHRSSIIGDYYLEEMISKMNILEIFTVSWISDRTWR